MRSGACTRLAFIKLRRSHGSADASESLRTVELVHMVKGRYHLHSLPSRNNRLMIKLGVTLITEEQWGHVVHTGRLRVLREEERGLQRPR